MAEKGRGGEQGKGGKQMSTEIDGDGDVINNDWSLLSFVLLTDWNSISVIKLLNAIIIKNDKTNLDQNEMKILRLEN